MYKSQNSEVQVILGYFGDFRGTLLDVGANDGKTFSNSYDLIKMGWNGLLVEPSSAYESLIKLYADNHHVCCIKAGIAKESGTMTLAESGAHVKDGNDHALVSSFNLLETQRWRNSGVKFTDVEVDVITFEELPHPHKFDFISIDVEGLEMDILEQIDLTGVGCSVLCIEWNGNKQQAFKFTNYCYKHGLKEIHRNAENLIFAKTK